MLKKIPMRMCVACRQSYPKTELLRVVRTEEENIVIDRTGKRNGRGAYICAKTACFEKALKSHAIDRALHVTLDELILVIHRLDDRVVISLAKIILFFETANNLYDFL